MDVVHRYFEAFNAGDIDGMLDCLTDEIAHHVNEGQVRTGKVLFRDFCNLQTDAGLPEATGQTYQLPAGSFFDIRDGCIARVTTYYNLADWIRQVRA